MKNLILLFFIFVSFSLFSQKYTVNRVYNVFEIKDSLGKSIYQCFADTVILFQKADFAYIIKDKKIGLYSIEFDTLIFGCNFSQLNYVRFNESDFLDSKVIPIKPEFQIEISEKLIDRRLIGFLRFRKNDKLLWSLDHSTIRVERFADSDIIFFNESYSNEPLEPYHRYLPDGIRIDSIATDKNGNQIFDCMGNPHFQYPPAVVYHKDIFIDISNNKCIPFPNYEEAWFENDLIITYNDSTFNVYENSFQAVQSGNWKELFADQQKFKQFYSRLFPKGVSPIYDSVITGTKNFYNSDQFSNHDQFEISVFKDGKSGDYMLFKYGPFWREEWPIIYDYSSMHVSILGDEVTVNPCSNKYVLKKEASSYLGIGICVNSCKGEFRDCLTKSIEAVLRGAETDLFDITRKEELLIINSFSEDHLTCRYGSVNDESTLPEKLCVDSKNVFREDCPYKNIQNKSGVFDPKSTSWILPPMYSFVLPVVNGYIVYRVVNVVNEIKRFTYKLQSGLFDGKNWTIPMTEQYLVEDNGVIMKKVNGKLLPIK